MSEKYFRVGAHGPPNPGEHPWVMAKFDGSWWRLIHVPDFPGRHWADGELWFPVDAPPSELAPPPEDQGVEVDGRRWKVENGVVYSLRNAGTKYEAWHNWLPADSAAITARVAAALGLVDQPPVPRALVTEMHRWISDRFCDPNVRYATTTLLGRIEAGEFGPVEPSVERVGICGDERPGLTSTHVEAVCTLPAGHDGWHHGEDGSDWCREIIKTSPAPSVEWVTDRLPNDDERPVLWRDDEGMYWLRYGEGFFSEGDPWVSLSVLLDAAGLGER